MGHKNNGRNIQCSNPARQRPRIDAVIACLKELARRDRLGGRCSARTVPDGAEGWYQKMDPRSPLTLAASPWQEAAGPNHRKQASHGDLAAYLLSTLAS